MSLIKKEGNILEDADLDCIVNPINIVGVMGAGLALALKTKYPEHFNEYKRLCDSKALIMREVVLVSSGAKKPQCIILFPTKEHWKDKSELKVIEFNLMRLAYLLTTIEASIDYIGLPAVGCGRGGLNHNDVFDLASFYLKYTKQEVRWYRK